jgi:hypothetical protein
MFGIWLAAATDGALLGYATSYRLKGDENRCWRAAHSEVIRMMNEKVSAATEAMVI